MLHHMSEIGPFLETDDETARHPEPAVMSGQTGQTVKERLFEVGHGVGTDARQCFEIKFGLQDGSQAVYVGTLKISI
jgi:hypothetical protein